MKRSTLTQRILQPLAAAGSHVICCGGGQAGASVLGATAGQMLTTLSDYAPLIMPVATAALFTVPALFRSNAQQACHDGCEIPHSKPSLLQQFGRQMALNTVMGAAFFVTPMPRWTGQHIAAAFNQPARHAPQGAVTGALDPANQTAIALYQDTARHVLNPARYRAFKTSVPVLTQPARPDITAPVTEISLAEYAWRQGGRDMTAITGEIRVSVPDLPQGKKRFMALRMTPEDRAEFLKAEAVKAQKPPATTGPVLYANKVSAKSFAKAHTARL